MTVLEIINYASNRLVKKTIDSADGLDWVKEALEQLGVEARKFSTQSISAAANVWSDLPSGCLKIYGVQDSAGEDYLDWEVDQTRIRFADSDAFTLRYYILPAPPADINATPDCPGILHRCFAYYVAYSFYRNYFPGQPDASFWLSEYRDHLMNAIGNLQKRKRRIDVIVARSV